MDKFHSCHIGVRDGRVCPCCAPAHIKAKVNRIARHKLAAITRKEINEEVSEAD